MVKEDAELMKLIWMRLQGPSALKCGVHELMIWAGSFTRSSWREGIRPVRMTVLCPTVMKE